jgi:hypothetical protein
MKHIFTIIIAVVFVSCSTPKKLNKLMNKLPEATAKECSQRFPIKETTDTLTITDTAMLQAYEQEYLRVILMLNDMMNKGCDTIIREKIKEVVKTIPSKPQTKVVVKTQESTAKLQVVKDSCDKLVKEFVTINQNNATTIDNLMKTNGKLKGQNNWLWLIVILLLIWIFRKQVLSLIKKVI